MDRPEIVVCTNDLEKGASPYKKHDQHQEKNGNVHTNTYHDRVIAPRLQYRPWLESLHQFMDPCAKGFSINLAHRMKHFDIEVIHFPKSGKPDPVIQCFNPEDFKGAISEDKERTGTLVIAKDISQAMIEALGTRLELEPEFFANHLAGTELYRMGRTELPTLRAPARAPHLLPDYTRKAPFYTAEYRRPYHIKDGQNGVIKLRAAETSTPRGVLPIHPDLPDVFGFEKISVYKKRGSNIGRPGLINNQQQFDTMMKSDIYASSRHYPY